MTSRFSDNNNKNKTHDVHIWPSPWFPLYPLYSGGSSTSQVWNLVQTPTLSDGPYPSDHDDTRVCTSFWVPGPKIKNCLRRWIQHASPAYRPMLRWFGGCVGPSLTIEQPPIDWVCDRMIILRYRPTVSGLRPPNMAIVGRSLMLLIRLFAASPSINWDIPLTASGNVAWWLPLVARLTSCHWGIRSMWCVREGFRLQIQEMRDVGSG